MPGFIKHAVALVITATIAVPSVAFADEVGARGTVSSLEVNTAAGDTYLQYHGRIMVLTGNKNTTSTAEYRWGGTSCGSRTLTENQVAMLQRALESGTPIMPRFQNGQGSTKCLVGIAIAP
jgi:hypothetical protein